MWRPCATEGYYNYEQLVKGLYSVFLPDYLAAFPREQLLIFRSEEYNTDIEGHLERTIKHLGLEKPAADVWVRVVGCIGCGGCVVPLPCVQPRPVRGGPKA